MLTDIAHQRAVQILHGGEDGLRAHITLNAREPVLDPIEPGRGKRPANPCWRLSCAGNPAVRKQFTNVGGFVGRQSREDIFQIGVGIMPIELG